jgi:NitT/TauT family transport system substrate-binding protein
MAAPPQRDFASRDQGHSLAPMGDLVGSPRDRAKGRRRAMTSGTVGRMLMVAGMVAGVLALAAAGPARAEVSELHMMNSYGISFLPVLVLEHDRLIEQQAKQAGLGDLTVTWIKGGTGNNASDALLSGSTDFAATGSTPMITLWDKTYGSIGVKGVSAMSHTPFQLNTRNPAVTTVKDFTDKDRIVVPGVLISPQAVLLQMAAEQAFGKGQHTKLDPLTVTMTNPDGMVAIVSNAAEITAHFTTPPFSYLELGYPGLRKLTDSTEILGGPSTLNLVFTTTKFHDQNPKTYAAVVAALKQAVAAIQADKPRAAEIYLAMMNDKKTPVADILAIMNRPEISFTTTPQNVKPFADFLYRTGRTKHDAKSWRDLFFPEVHDLPGS